MLLTYNNSNTNTTNGTSDTTNGTNNANSTKVQRTILSLCYRRVYLH